MIQFFLEMKKVIFGCECDNKIPYNNNWRMIILIFALKEKKSSVLNYNLDNDT